MIESEHKSAALLKATSLLILAMNDIEYQIECTARNFATYLVKDFSFDAKQALRAVYNSQPYQKLCVPKTGLCFQSPLYVYDYLKNEIKTGKLQ